MKKLFASLRSKRRAPHSDLWIDDTLRLVAEAMGHRSSELADIFGGYQCACERSSWIHLPEFGLRGGCSEGWADARAALKALAAAGHLSFPPSSVDEGNPDR